MFSKMFGVYSGFSNAVNRIMDIIWLNILTVIGCIPIVTIATSLTACYTVTLKMVNDEEGYITKEFIKAFKQNFKRTILVGIALVIFFLASNKNIEVFQKVQYGRGLVLTVYIIMFAVLVGVLYLFPVLARYDLKVKDAIKNAYIYAITSFPKTIFMIACDIIMIAFFYVIKFLLFYTAIVGVAFTCYMNSKIIMSIFKRFETAENK